MIILEEQAKQIIIQDAVDSYPNECCGFVFGSVDESGRRIISAATVVNKRRFAFAPEDYMQAERYAEAQQLQLLGVYHSHPNHAAVPSERDRAVVQPFFSYLIISVNEKEAGPIRSWRLNEDGDFEEENKDLLA
jgi:proteasome lid subunit RPN8/RPN11